MTDRWTLLYDSDCGFCISVVAAIVAWDRSRALRPRSIQGEGGGRALADLSPEQRLASFHLVSPDGERYSGGPALAPLLRLLPGGRPAATALERVPRVADRGYAFVSGKRSTIGRLLPKAVKRRAKARVLDAERAGPA